ncbi:hypothetical protein ABW21_db0208684 [Orbilia brochopaga]|nr:hypothetical protein ABW21_db0208684 [Drechslerella brochopaga]
MRIKRRAILHKKNCTEGGSSLEPKLRHHILTDPLLINQRTSIDLIRRDTRFKMGNDRVSTRSSRRLQAAVPEPPSPPKSDVSDVGDGIVADSTFAAIATESQHQDRNNNLSATTETRKDGDSKILITPGPESPTTELKTPRSTRSGGKRQIPVKTKPIQEAPGAQQDFNTNPKGIADSYLPSPVSAPQTRSGKRKAEPAEELLATGEPPDEAPTPTPKSTRRAKKQKPKTSSELPPAGVSSSVDVAPETELSVLPAATKTDSQKTKVAAKKPNKRPQEKAKVETIHDEILPEIDIDKPPSIGKPAIWCDTRQELCESLPSFRAYQSGCYAVRELGRGCLIDNHGSDNDYIDASIVITHAGGNSEDVEGERTLVKDQKWDNGMISNLRRNLEKKIPLVAIIGQKCATAPAKLEHRYAVMDWMKVTHCWPERDRQSGKVRCKFRLEKLDSTQKGWWAAEDSLGIDPHMSFEYIKCETCEKVSPYIYDAEPMCLNQDCNKFWIVIRGEGQPEEAPQRFLYRKSFLHGKADWSGRELEPPARLEPTLPVAYGTSENGGRDVKRRFWKGVWCQNCGKLNCRELWKGWKCTNCAWEFNPRRSHFVPADLADPHRLDFTGPPIPENTADPSIRATCTVLPDGRRAITYDVYQCGQVTHILANKNWNALPDGSDWLFEQYQDEEMPFKRHELKTHKCQGRLLTQQFSYNSGVSYKYIVEVDSLTFEDSPPVVQQALKVIQDDVSKMVPGALPMNEILNVAYFEEQKMDFHDDGEEDLGPCISSISLGSPAVMSFRIKKKYQRDDVSDEDKAMLRPSNPDAANAGGRQGKRVFLELRLHHGDVIIMNGRPIQKYIEHAVVPEGFRIAATARNINVQNTKVNAASTFTNKKAKLASKAKPRAKPMAGVKTHVNEETSSAMPDVIFPASDTMDLDETPQGDVAQSFLPLDAPSPLAPSPSPTMTPWICNELVDFHPASFDPAPLHHVMPFVPKTGSPSLSSHSAAYYPPAPPQQPHIHNHNYNVGIPAGIPVGLPAGNADVQLPEGWSMEQIQELKKMLNGS